ncbi:MAG: ABC transporter ATP-binding protein [Deltaproteobacteria bacterium]|nr:ABC transporter ATP-binding protein [Deltaproteobacteria bacterium]
MSLFSEKLLEIENLRMRIKVGNRLIRAINGISLNVAEGETLGIVGESGSGKSMLCRAILGLFPQDAVLEENSVIKFKGCDLTQLTEKQLNKIRGKEISLILQNPMTSLNPVIKTGKQISETLVRHLKIKRKTAWKQAVLLIKSVGIPMPERIADQYPYSLSGGMRQRAAIAIAISCEPKLLIADEPTTALDVTLQAEIMNLLGELSFRNKMAMILVSHDFGVIANRTNKVAVMYAGKIVEMACMNKLFTKARMPYTRALINSIPKIEDKPFARLDAIKGTPPNLAQLPSGCSFSPRCNKAKKRCFEKEPRLTFDTDDKHLFACWHPI